MKKFFARFKPVPRYTLTLFMKSGNQIILHNVRKFDFAHTGNEITQIEVAQDTVRYLPKLFVQSIAMDQIEAITVTRT